jgi:hypothetical protein
VADLRRARAEVERDVARVLGDALVEAAIAYVKPIIELDAKVPRYAGGAVALVEADGPMPHTPESALREAIRSWQAYRAGERAVLGIDRDRLLRAAAMVAGSRGASKHASFYGRLATAYDKLSTGHPCACVHCNDVCFADPGEAICHECADEPGEMDCHAA